MPKEPVENTGYSGRVNAWCLYDWANSAFATTVMAALLPIFYTTVAAAGLSGNRATILWGYTTSISLALAAILSPIIGSAADILGRRKRFLLVFATTGALATLLLTTVREGEFIRASLFYILAHVPFVLSIVCYDSLLPHIGRADDLDRVSSRGFAIGYLGGGLLLLLNTAMVIQPGLFALPSADAAIRLSFVTVSVWWILFTIPLARKIAEPPPSQTRDAGGGAAIALRTLRRLAITLREIRQHREAMKFLIAFWLYGDGIGTIIKMAVIYGKEVGIGTNDLIGSLLVVQFVGIPFAILFGRIAKRIGARSGILIGLAVYTLIAGGAYFLSQPWHFWLLALLVGMVQGGTQALSRSLFASLTPRDKSGEWFGFFSVSSRFAGIFGPLLFALIGQLTGSSRIGIAALILFFISGGFLLTRVKLCRDSGVPWHSRRTS